LETSQKRHIYARLCEISYGMIVSGFKCEFKWVLRTYSLSPHLVPAPCLHTLSPHFISLRFVPTLRLYALSKAAGGRRPFAKQLSCIAEEGKRVGMRLREGLECVLHRQACKPDTGSLQAHQQSTHPALPNSVPNSADST